MCVAPSIPTGRNKRGLQTGYVLMPASLFALHHITSPPANPAFARMNTLLPPYPPTEQLIAMVNTGEFTKLYLDSSLCLWKGKYTQYNLKRGRQDLGMCTFWPQILKKHRATFIHWITESYALINRCSWFHSPVAIIRNKVTFLSQENNSQQWHKRCCFRHQDKASQFTTQIGTKPRLKEPNPILSSCSA